MPRAAVSPQSRVERQSRLSACPSHARAVEATGPARAPPRPPSRAAAAAHARRAAPDRRAATAPWGCAHVAGLGSSRPLSISSVGRAAAPAHGRRGRVRVRQGWYGRRYALDRRLGRISDLHAKSLIPSASPPGRLWGGCDVGANLPSTLGWVRRYSSRRRRQRASSSTSPNGVVGPRRGAWRGPRPCRRQRPALGMRALEQPRRRPPVALRRPDDLSDQGRLVLGHERRRVDRGCHSGGGQRPERAAPADPELAGRVLDAEPVATQRHELSDCLQGQDRRATSHGPDFGTRSGRVFFAATVPGVGKHGSRETLPRVKTAGRQRSRGLGGDERSVRAASRLCLKQRSSWLPPRSPSRWWTSSPVVTGRAGYWQRSPCLRMSSARMRAMARLGLRGLCGSWWTSQRPLPFGVAARQHPGSAHTATAHRMRRIVAPVRWSRHRLSRHQQRLHTIASGRPGPAPVRSKCWCGSRPAVRR